ncbi:RE1, partial [Symbiodinium sp. CCMP2456]
MWREQNGWVPRSLKPSQTALICFEDKNEMAMWSLDQGRGKALTHGQGKKISRSLQALTDLNVENKDDVVWKLVSPEFDVSVFQCSDEAMATLDPSCQSSLWDSLRKSSPRRLTLFPSQSDESNVLARDVAEWQASNGRSFVMLCDAGTKLDYVEAIKEEQDWVCTVRENVVYVSNDHKMLEEVFDFPQNHEAHQNEVNCFPQNHKAHQDEVNCFHQNQEAHQDEVSCFHQNQEAHQDEVSCSHQNQEAHQDEVSCFHQNQEAHQGSKFYVDESQRGGSFFNQESQHGGSFLTSDQVQWVEERAKIMLEQKDYSLWSLEKILNHFPQNKFKQRASVDNGQYVVFGLYAYGNQYGLTNRSAEMPNFVVYINELLRFQSNGRFQEKPTWTTFALGLNAGSLPHRDVNNRTGSRNYVLGLGKYQNGEVWVQDESCAKTHKVLPGGEKIQVRNLNIKNKMCEFDPKKWHGSQSWTGCRYVISAYTSRGFDEVDEAEMKRLRQLGFELPRDRIYVMYDGSERRTEEKCSKVFVEEYEMDERQEDVPRRAQPHADENMRPTNEELRLLHKLHQNLGHPGAKELARSLKLARAKPHIVRYMAREFRCEVCEARPKPKSARPAVLPRSYEPGRVVGVDVIYLRALDPRDSFPCLNICDWGTGYQMVERLRSVEADHTWRTFLRVWGRTFGIPEIIIPDLGTEFRGVFADQAAQAGALVRHTGARSPWQAGKTERAGAHYKAILEKARDTAQISSWEELKSLMLEVEAAKNRYGNRSGFSPMQRQIGHSLRLPGSLLSDDSIDPTMIVQSAGDEMRRLLEIRQHAQEAYMKTQTEIAVTKAKNARTRRPLNFVVGETVYVFRQPKERKRKHAMTPESHESRKPMWVGPGIVLAIEGPNLWVSMKGELWKVSIEQCRPATSEEQFAKEMLAGELEALELGRASTKRSYKDMTEDEGKTGYPNLNHSDLDWKILLRYQFLLEKFRMKLKRRSGPQLDWKERWMSSECVDHWKDRFQCENPSLFLPQVMRNERLDGNFPGSPPYEAARRLNRYRPQVQRPYFVQKQGFDDGKAWFSLDENGWIWEKDCWEETSKELIVRHHVEPRDELCDPNKVKGALMPRRLKYRSTYAIDELGNVQTFQDNWVRAGKKNSKVGCSWTGGKPRGQGEIFDHEIKAEDRPGWRETDLQEWSKVVSTGAVRVLDVKESREVRAKLEAEGKLERILPSRMVRRMKPAEQPGEPDVRKSRWCIRGDKDPDLLSLERFSPTLCSTTFGVLLQACASMGYAASVGDLKNAFCQSLPLKRAEGALYAMQPKGGIEGLHEEQLIQIIAGCYGLPDAPMHWRRSLKESSLALGYRESVLDPTVYLLHDECKLQGAIAVEVDDLFNFGSDLHYKKMDELKLKYKFGKFEMLRGNESGVGFNGRRIKQLDDYGFVVDMMKFVTERLEPIQFAKGRKSRPKALANESEIAQARAVVGSLNWASREGRPDAAAAASLSSSKFPKPIIEDLIDMNKAVKMIKARPDLSIKIRPIKPECLAWGVITDASFDNAGDGRSQGAFGVIAFHEDLQKGFRVPCSLITWRSGRIQRVVNSTLAAETQSLSKGLGELCWIMSAYNEVMDPDFTIEQWESRISKNKVMAMVSDESTKDFKEALCIVDAKALYDHLSRESVGPSQDKRTSLEIQVIRQNMNAINGKIKWVPHPQMAIDGLTKKNANMDSLYQLLDTGEYQIVEMAKALQEKKEEREQRGYN